MSEECTHDCSTCSENCGEREAETEDLSAKLNPEASVKKVYAVVSGKGGVGKSLVTSLLACEMQRRGHQTAILDADMARTTPSSSKSQKKAASRISRSKYITVQREFAASCPPHSHRAFFLMFPELLFQTIPADTPIST